MNETKIFALLARISLFPSRYVSCFWSSGWLVWSSKLNASGKIHFVRFNRSLLTRSDFKRTKLLLCAVCWSVQERWILAATCVSNKNSRNNPESKERNGSEKWLTCALCHLLPSGSCCSAECRSRAVGSRGVVFLCNWDIFTLFFIIRPAAWKKKRRILPASRRNIIKNQTKWNVRCKCDRVYSDMSEAVVQVEEREGISNTGEFNTDELLLLQPPSEPGHDRLSSRVTKTLRSSERPNWAWHLDHGLPLSPAASRLSLDSHTPSAGSTFTEWDMSQSCVKINH